MHLRSIHYNEATEQQPQSITVYSLPYQKGSEQSQPSRAVYTPVSSIEDEMESELKDLAGCLEKLAMERNDQ